MELFRMTPRLCGAIRRPSKSEMAPTVEPCDVDYLQAERRGVVKSCFLLTTTSGVSEQSQRSRQPLLLDTITTHGVVVPWSAARMPRREDSLVTSGRVALESR